MKYITLKEARKRWSKIPKKGTLYEIKSTHTGEFKIIKHGEGYMIYFYRIIEILAVMFFTLKVVGVAPIALWSWPKVLIPACFMLFLEAIRYGTSLK